MPQRFVNYHSHEALEAAGSPPEPEAYGYTSYWDGEPDDYFFKNAADDAPALFSSYRGTRVFRTAYAPVEGRTDRWWTAEEIILVAAEIRGHFWTTCKEKIKRVTNYWALYEYFDAYDIYARGALNLYRVINLLHWENLHMKPEITYFHLEAMAWNFLDQGKFVQRNLLGWDSSAGVAALFRDGEMKEFARIPEADLEVLKEIFVRQREILMRDPPRAFPTFPVLPQTYPRVLGPHLGLPRNDPRQVMVSLCTTNALVVHGSTITAARTLPQRHEQDNHKHRVSGWVPTRVDPLHGPTQVFTKE